MAALSDSALLALLRSRFESAGQGHVFKFLDAGELSHEEITTLVDQLKRIDLVQLRKNTETTFAHTSAAAAAAAAGTVKETVITPFRDLVDATQASPAERQKWWDCGINLIAHGGVGVLLMAGGQGTRLGSALPKGMYDIGLPSHKSLYELFVERARCLSILAWNSQPVGSRPPAPIPIPFYVMTSDQTHAHTVNFFRSNNFWGMKPDDVFFFQQPLLPCFDMQGKLILESKCTFAWAPNGNGGMYEALGTTGALEHMKARGVEALQCFSVDNVINRVADPYFIGFCVSHGADCGNKVVPKAHAHEAVGVMAYKDGKPGVVEYSELSKERAETTENGQLVYGAANIAIHFFSRAFLERMQYELPYHIAQKKIPFCDEKGALVVPVKPNGIKLERFVFDTFAYAQKLIAFQTVRGEEFSPVKNAEGADSPATARRDVTRLHRSWIERAGGRIIQPPSDELLIEVSPQVSYCGEGLEARVKGKEFSAPILIRD